MALLCPVIHQFYIAEQCLWGLEHRVMCFCLWIHGSLTTYYYDIHLTAFFQNNLVKPAPER